MYVEERRQRFNHMYKEDNEAHQVYVTWYAVFQQLNFTIEI